MIREIVLVELDVVGIAAIFLTPVALVQALAGRWLGLNAYARAAAWGGVFLVAVLFAVAAVSQ